MVEDFDFQILDLLGVFGEWVKCINAFWVIFRSSNKSWKLRFENLKSRLKKFGSNAGFGYLKIFGHVRSEAQPFTLCSFFIVRSPVTHCMIACYSFQKSLVTRHIWNLILLQHSLLWVWTKQNERRSFFEQNMT